jgi:hypothetical protein
MLYPTLTAFSRGPRTIQAGPDRHPRPERTPPVQHLFQAITIFACGCVLIHAGRAYARATTVLLSTTALMLSLTLGTVLCQRIGLPTGSAEAGVLLYGPPTGRAVERGDQ